MIAYKKTTTRIGISAPLSIVLLLIISSFSVHAEISYVQLKTQRGSEQSFLLIDHPAPKAAVLLFAGGKGALKLKPKGAAADIRWGKKNFLVRTREKFSQHGFLVALIDAPSDYHGKKGMLGGFRSSPSHVDDIDRVIAHVRSIADVPVWLIGTSRGTESVSTIAISSKQKPHGLILTSSMTDSDRKGESVLDKDLHKIKIPTLITHHKRDGCKKTRPEKISKIKDRLSNAPVVEMMMFDGGREESKPCRARSYHGYLGIEDEVVDYISDFIVKH